jgi:SAM-dependent MidA family methyltransferase
MPLPPPDAAALEQSRALAHRIRHAIADAGGWIGFDRYMAMALYEPGLGYYSSGTRKFGAGGDFVTAPELTPLFGRTVATQVAEWFGTAARRVVEFGAGSGALAAQLLDELERLGTPADEYCIVELSADLVRRQRETIARDAPAQLARVRWLDRMPESIDGVIVANELLDAMPVRLFEATHEALHEVGVGFDGPGDGRTDQGGDAFGWQVRAADDGLREAVDAALARAGVDDIAADGGARAARLAAAAGGRYRSELGEQAQAWVRTAARSLRRGAMLLIDYGFPAREFHHPQRSSGTLVGHYRHRVHTDVLRWPGLQDITAHVDFTAVAEAARGEGLALLGYASQARFLIDCGLLDRLAGHGVGDGVGDGTVERTRMLSAAQALLSEAEMGELFKVVAFGRSMPAEPIGFRRGDRSAALQADMPLARA